MAVSKDNTRTLITISKELKKELEELAEQDGRSFSNFVNKVLKDYIANK